MKGLAPSFVAIQQFLPPRFVAIVSLPLQRRHDHPVPNVQLVGAKTAYAAIRIIENAKGDSTRGHIGVQAINHVCKLLFKRQFDRMLQRSSPKGCGETLRSMKMTSSAFWQDASPDIPFHLKNAEDAV